MKLPPLTHCPYSFPLWQNFSLFLSPAQVSWANQWQSSIARTSLIRRRYPSEQLRNDAREVIGWSAESITCRTWWDAFDATGLPSQRTLCLHTPRFPLWYVRNLFKWDVWEDVGFLQSPRGGHPPDTNPADVHGPFKANSHRNS